MTRNVHQMFCKRIIATAIVAFALISIQTVAFTQQVNVWTNSSGGMWEDLSWLEGPPPPWWPKIVAVITNAGSKTITIGSNTWANHNGSLNVERLILSAPPGSTNHLLIDLPDSVLAFDELGLRTGVGINGILESRGATLRLVSDTTIDGSWIQSGGVLEAMRAEVNGTVSLTNTETTFSSSLRIPRQGRFEQMGGTSVIPAILLSGTYRLFDGTLVTGPLQIAIVGSGGTFYQSGGLLITPEIQSGGIYTGSQSGGSFEVADGTVYTGRILVGPACFFRQSGGDVTITNDLRAAGTSVTSYGMAFASCTLDGGMLSVSSIDLDRARFNHTGGSNHVSGLLKISGNDWGYISWYRCSGGALFARDIAVINGAVFSLEGATESGRITNPGYFRLEGALLTGRQSEHLGRLVLSGYPAAIDLGGEGVLRFADSSGTAWGGSLSISNWVGTSRGGGKSQLFFGINAFGLTAAQIERIRFINPHGFPAGNYSARMLSTGEVVPATALSYEVGLSEFILRWPEPFILQSATNLSGPYVDIPDVSSPYTNVFSTTPRRFFRLRQP